ncbi:MAG TPA: amino acid adenylation domain-containing protein, partial [Pyrinomonadaceae bacterium]|nr:amino acid adenylation domain-containing protein [Pyrinomonadaceae bacterium]
MSNTDIEDILSLSPIQKGLLFHSLYAPDAGVYFQQVNCVLRGNLDLQAFREAWQQSINRHAILRTSFFWEDLEEPVQVVNREVTLPIELEDWSKLPDSEQQARLRDFLEADRRRGFELSSAPLLRLALMRLDEERYRLVWSHHHLLLDGWSIPLLLKEVFTVYEALCSKKPVQLDQARPYRDYITWLQRQRLEEAERYWREKLRGLKSPTPLALGAGREARAEGESEYREQRLQLNAAETAELNAVARRHQLTLNTMVQGAWGLLLSRYSGERDVLFGTTVAGRPAELSGVEQMVGVFINTLPMRVQIDEKERVSEWLQGLQAEAVEMRQYEHSPLVEVAKWSEMPRGTALFESLLVFENYPVNSNGSPASPERNGKSAIPTIEDISYYRRVNYPLTMVVVPREELKLSLSYEADRFDDETITRMLGHFRQLLRGIAADPQQRICDLSLLTSEERQQLLVEFNNTKTEFPQNACIHELFEQQVAQRRDAVALVCEEEQLTYDELNERANRLAHLLRGRGVGVETTVGICLPRSVEMVLSILAILKAGGVYVPLDGEYPAERLSFMCSDAAVALVLTNREQAEVLAAAGVPTLCLDELGAELAAQAPTNLESEVAGEHLAYIVYTSGSTGKPKGVAITQRSVSRLVFGVDYARLDEQQCVLLAAPITFDAATFELWGALLHGGRCVLAVERVLSSSEIGRLVRRHGVTTMFLTTALFNSVVDEDVTQLRGVQQLLVGGEALSVKHMRWAQEELGEITIGNVYGPTEATTFTSYERMGVVAEGVSTIPIGKPIGNTTVYVLDKRMQPVAPGVRGELYIGGPGLARGYVGRADLTAEKFVPHPYSERGGERLYRTGDVVWQHGDGRVEFVGRRDQQVKVRGHRIELGEIEAVLREQASIDQAVVVVQEERAGDKRLVAYVVKAEAAVEGVKEWRSYLKERLPEYMVPGQFVELAELPLNANGKVDRKALPEVEGKVADLGVEYVAPRTPVEEVLAGIWSDVLRVEQVGVSDNFFELGGHSLLATQIISRVREAFGVSLPMRSVFESLTLGDLAYRVESSMKSQQEVLAPPVRPVPRDADLPLSLAQQRLWVFDRMTPGSSVYNIPITNRLMMDLDVAVLQRTFDEIIRRHESLRTTFP